MSVNKATIQFESKSQLAKQRVAERVSKGGHHIPPEIIKRRFNRGIFNLINLYLPICENWIIIDNMDMMPELIAKGKKEFEKIIINSEIWDTIFKQSRNARP